VSAGKFADLGLIWLEVVDADGTCGLRERGTVDRGCGWCGDAAYERGCLRSCLGVDARCEVGCNGWSLRWLFAVRRTTCVGHDRHLIEYRLRDGKSFDTKRFEVDLSVQHTLAQCVAPSALDDVHAQ